MKMNEIQAQVQAKLKTPDPDGKQIETTEAKEASAPVFPEFSDVHIRLIFAKERNPVVPKQVREILKQSYLQRNAVS